MIKITQHNGLVKYSLNDAQICLRKEIHVKCGSGALYKFSLVLDTDSLNADLGKYGRYIESFKIEDDVIVSDISVNVTTDEKFIIQSPIEYPKSTTIPYFMIPGFLYGSNNLATSDGPQPKFDYGGKIDWPNSSKFFVRSDRSANSSVIRIANGVCSAISIEHVIEGIKVDQVDKWSPAHLYTGLMLDSSFKDKDITGFQIGYENSPARFSWRKEEEVPEANEKLFGFIENEKGSELKVRTIFSFENAKNNNDYGNVLRRFYKYFHQEPVKVGKRFDSISDIGNSIITDGYNRDSKIFGLSDDEDGRNLGNIAWTGGMQAAYPVLKAGLYLDNEKFINTSKEFINGLCNNAFNEKSGLFNEEHRDGKWQITGWWGTREDCFNFGDEPKHSAYLNGQCCYYILKSYLLFDESNKNWLLKSQSVLDTVLKTQKGNGAFGVFFDPANGKAVDYDGFQGCWFVPAFTMLYKITKDEKYLVAAQKGLEHYYSWHLKGELYNTPMDTHRAVDQEGNLAFVVACCELHKTTENKKYIDYGLKGLDWEFSWKFSYNTKFSNNPLKDLKWSSCGGSITSTHNPSIHQMGNLIAGEIYYFYKLTDDEYLKSRLKDTCLWGLNAYNVYDGYLGFGTKGQTTEQFTYTDGVVLPWPHPWDGGIWEANLPWAAACILLSCAENIPNEFFGE